MGGFVFTWESNGEIYGQIFDDLGNKVGSEFPINTYYYSSQRNPVMCTLKKGGFVVTWESYRQDSSYNGIYGQLYDDNANKVGSDFLINTYLSDSQNNPVMCTLRSGGFIVTWVSYGQDDSYNGIYGQIFNDLGNKIGSEFRISNYQSTRTVSPLIMGGFVFTWESNGEIYGQIFDDLGNKIGSEFQVNTYYLSSQRNPSVSFLNGGGFIVVWDSPGQDGNY